MGIRRVALEPLFLTAVASGKRAVGGHVFQLDVELRNGMELKNLRLVDERLLELPDNYNDDDIETVSVPLTQIGLPPEMWVHGLAIVSEDSDQPRLLITGVGDTIVGVQDVSGEESSRQLSMLIENGYYVASYFDLHRKPALKEQAVCLVDLHAEDIQRQILRRGEIRKIIEVQQDRPLANFHGIWMAFEKLAPLAKIS